MKLPGVVGCVILLLLSGCANTGQSPSTITPLPVAPEPAASPSPASQGTIARLKAVSEIDTLTASIDHDLKSNPQSERFFTGFLVNEGQTRLGWEEFATEKQRADDTHGGYPDTWITVQRTRKGQTYASFERGMASGVGWREYSEYYFRSNSTLAKLVFLKSSPVRKSGSELTQYYDAKGKLLYSSTSSRKGKATNHTPEIYYRVSSLPIYHLLKKPKP